MRGPQKENPTDKGTPKRNPNKYGVPKEKTQREMKKKNVARKAAGLELQEPNWDCICKQQKQPEMQESCPGALGSDVATNHTWRRALRLSCLLAATAGPAQPPA